MNGHPEHLARFCLGNVSHDLLKLRQVSANVEQILAIELMAAAQGIDFRRKIMGGDKSLGRGTAPVYRLIREHVPFIEEDTVLYRYMEQVHQLVAGGRIAEATDQILR